MSATTVTHPEATLQFAKMAGMATKTPGEQRPQLRRDAARNRQRLLEAAREVFGERGCDAPFEEIARRAGVGIGTLYRRFPTREALIDALFEEKARNYVRASEEALAADDAWEGFAGFVERICEMQADDRGFADVLTATFPSGSAPGIAAALGDAHRSSVKLVARAQRDGQLRSDFTDQDLVWILIANAAYLEATRQVAPNAWRRYVTLILDAARTPDASKLPSPPTPKQLKRALDVLSASSRKT
jgi:AcrR family transcriptional regulator